MDSFLRGLPEARNSHGGGGKSACRPGWQLTGIFWIALFGVAAFVALEVAIVSKSDDLNETTKATVAMHKETIEMRTNTEGWINNMRSHFPVNQETLTIEQVLDAVDKVHAMMAWVDQVRRGVPSESVQTIVHNVNKLVGNATLFVEMATAVFGVSKDETKETRARLINSASSVFAKTSELINSVSTAEFHAAFETGHAAVQAVVRLSQSIDPAKVGKLVDSASDIMGAADTAHIVTVISDLSRGASEIIHRLSRPGGLRLSLPMEELMSPAPSPTIALKQK